ncbi:pyrimidine 5'-nucleotidase [Thermohalobaculum xanthum]|nr:pyrimidine 5'-nucleotidase [Thermohalobaculum xanthum]
MTRPLLTMPQAASRAPDFTRIETWVFDLDNTLYHPSARLFDQIDRRMTDFIMGALGVARTEADRLRRLYWERYGITLKGLIDHHGVHAQDFLDHVHEIDLSGLKPDPALHDALARLPGRRLVHTNGARAHAERVLSARGLDGLFEGIYGIEDKGLEPKPSAAAYDRVREHARFDPARAAMVEDDARNLAVPKARGMATVWVCHHEGEKAPEHVDRRVTCLTRFLSELP